MSLSFFFPQFHHLNLGPIMFFCLSICLSLLRSIVLGPSLSPKKMRSWFRLYVWKSQQPSSAFSKTEATFDDLHANDADVFPWLVDVESREIKGRLNGWLDAGGWQDSQLPYSDSDSFQDSPFLLIIIAISCYLGLWPRWRAGRPFWNESESRRSSLRMIVATWKHNVESLIYRHCSPLAYFYCLHRSSRIPHTPINLLEWISSRLYASSSDCLVDCLDCFIPDNILTDQAPWPI